MDKQPTSAPRSYKLAWSYEDRVATQHLGSHKYSTSTRAIGELVANALDANASLVDVELIENPLGGIEKVAILDNGCGITPADLKKRFVVVGVEPSLSSDSARLGRLGVGRLAVHRIGTLSKWTTTAKVDGKCIQSTFTLRTDEGRKLEIQETEVALDSPTGTTIEVFNVLDAGKGLTAARISMDLLSQYCSFLLGHANRKIRVCGEDLDVQGLIESSEIEQIPSTDTIAEATLNHLTLRRSVDQSKFPNQVLFSAKGRTVASSQPEDAPSPQYLGIVECPYLDSLVTSNRELLMEMDWTCPRF